MSKKKTERKPKPRRARTLLAVAATVSLAGAATTVGCGDDTTVTGSSNDMHYPTYDIGNPTRDMAHGED